jgi:6-phosphogluconolactonase
MKMFRCWLCVLASSVILLSLMRISHGAEGAVADKYTVYVGTYTRGGESKGIYRLHLNSVTGEMTGLTPVAEAVNPSFLALDPQRKFLYAVSEISDLDGKPTGGVTAFRIDPATGDLTKINAQSSGGAGPCHLIVDHTGKNVLVANYGGGSAAVLPIAEDGSLKPASSVVQHEGSSVNPQRQKEPHAHSINLDRAGERAFVADLGLDKVMIYRFDPGAGKLAGNDPSAAEIEPGSGPRHFDFHPSGRFAYVINELASTITALAYDSATGALTELQTVSTLPSGFGGVNYTADIHVHPTGKFLYGSNRGHDSIVVFAIDEQTGELRHVQHQSTMGETPRNFGIDPSGRVLLAENQKSGTIYSFRIDSEEGRLSLSGHSIKVPAPVCVQFAP